MLEKREGEEKVEGIRSVGGMRRGKHSMTPVYVCCHLSRCLSLFSL